MFLGGGESPEKLEQINNVHFASDNELPLQQEEEPNMPTSPSNKPILEGTLIYRKDGRRLKTKNLRTVRLVILIIFIICNSLYLFVSLKLLYPFHLIYIQSVLCI